CRQVFVQVKNWGWLDGWIEERAKNEACPVIGTSKDFYVYHMSSQADDSSYGTQWTSRGPAYTLDGPSASYSCVEGLWSNGFQLSGQTWKPRADGRCHTEDAPSPWMPSASK